MQHFLTENVRWAKTFTWRIYSSVFHIHLERQWTQRSRCLNGRKAGGQAGSLDCHLLGHTLHTNYHHQHSRERETSLPSAPTYLPQLSSGMPTHRHTHVNTHGTLEKTHLKKSKQSRNALTWGPRWHQYSPKSSIHTKALKISHLNASERWEVGHGDKRQW